MDMKRVAVVALVDEFGAYNATNLFAALKKCVYVNRAGLWQRKILGMAIGHILRAPN